MHSQVAYFGAMQDPAVRQRIQTRFTIEELAVAGFNVASSLGSILASQQDFSDIRTIKALLLPILNSDADCSSALAERELWVLNQQRHLILHRRGVIDTRYVDATGDPRTIGTRLGVSPAELEIRLAAMVAAAKSLLAAAGKHAA